MNSLPKDLLIEIFGTLDLVEIKNVSKANKHLNRVCRLDYLWKIQAFADYPQLANQHLALPSSPNMCDKYNSITWRVFYISKYKNVEPIPVYHGTEKIGEIIVNKYNKIKRVKQKIKELITEPKYYEIWDKNGEIMSKTKYSRVSFDDIDKVVLQDPITDIAKVSTKRELKKIAKYYGLEQWGRHRQVQERVLDQFII